MIKAPLICETHGEEIKYFCLAEACYFEPLCDICANEHKSVHSKLQLMPTKKAYQLAESNLLKQETQIEKYLSPLTIRQNMLKIIDQQKQDLQKQKQILIQAINDKIDSEIRLLENNNESQLNKEELNIKKTLEFKLQEMFQLKSPSFDGKTSLLRKALNFESKTFMEEVVAKYNQNAHNRRGNARTKKFKVFQTTHHEIIISPLELRERAHEKTRQIKRTMNESPLYFLIDQNLNTSNLIYSMSPEEKKLFAYNTEYEDWSTLHVPLPAFKQAAAVHDHKNNRFFWIGGVETVEKNSQDQWGNMESSYSFGNQQRPSTSERSRKILVYEPESRDRPWRYLETQLSVQRSSCQAVLIQDKDDDSNYGILISGGLGPNGEVLRSTQFLDLSSQSMMRMEDTNFGAFAGSLVSYNKSNVLRIGGLYKNKADVAVVEVVERLDCTEWLKSRGKSPRWSYVELLVPEFERNDNVTLFHANQAAIQINPNQIFVFGGTTSGLAGSADSFIIGVEEFDIPSRSVIFGRSQPNKSGLKEENLIKQYKFTVRWANEKPLITGDDFSGQCPSIWKGKLHVLQNTGSDEMVNFQKRLLSFNMYEWSQIEDILPE